jgi:hypothetical protein
VDSEVRTSFGVRRASFLRPRNGVMCWRIVRSYWAWVVSRTVCGATCSSQ